MRDVTVSTVTRAVGDRCQAEQFHKEILAVMF